MFFHIHKHAFMFLTSSVININDVGLFILTAKPAQPAKRPIHLSPTVSIQPKPVITTVPIPQVTAPLQAKTIIIQPLQTTLLPVVKPPPVTIQPAPPTG